MYDVETEGSFKDIALSHSLVNITSGRYYTWRSLHVLQLWNVNLKDGLHDSSYDGRDLVFEVASAVEENLG